MTVCDPRWAVPSNPVLVELAVTHRSVVCVEENVEVGGVGAGLCTAMAEAGLLRPFRALGLPRQFLPAGTRAELLHRYGLDAAGIALVIGELDRTPRECR